MGWVEWVHWGLVALVLGGFVFYLTLTDSRRIRAGAQTSRSYCLLKYGTLAMLAGLFFTFLEHATGFSSDLDFLCLVVGLVVGGPAWLCGIKAMPAWFCGWLREIPKRKE